MPPPPPRPTLFPYTTLFRSIVVQGRDQERLPHRRQRLEPHRGGSLGEHDTAQTLTIAATGDVEIGEGAKVRELRPAPSDERERALRVFGNRLVRWRQQAGTAGVEREEEGEEASASAALSNHA